MRVLVTGGAGFIGHWVVRELLDLGHSVTALDDLSRGRRENLAGPAFEGRPGYGGLVVGDVRDRRLLAGMFRGADRPDLCIHLAARVNVQASLDDPRADFGVNVAGTHAVLEACRAAGTRLTLVSTCMVYAAAGADGRAITEDHPAAARSPYAGGKLAAEALGLAYHRAYGLPVTVLRPFNTYGPAQRTDAEGGVIAVFCRRALDGLPLQVFGDGLQTRDFLYVADCACFIVRASLARRAAGETINGATGVEISIGALARVILRLVRPRTGGRGRGGGGGGSGGGDGPPRGGLEHVPAPHPQSEIGRLYGDATKAELLFGWRPTVDLARGILLTAAWLREREPPGRGREGAG